MTAFRRRFGDFPAFQETTDISPWVASSVKEITELLPVAVGAVVLPVGLAPCVARVDNLVVDDADAWDICLLPIGVMLSLASGVKLAFCLAPL